MKGDPSLQHYVSMPMPGVRSMTGLDVHIADNRVYFSDSSQKKIYRVQTDGSNLTEVILISCTWKDTLIHYYSLIHVPLSWIS